MLAGRANRVQAVRTAAGIGVVLWQARLPVPPPGTPARPSPISRARPKNAYVREDQILPRLAAIAILLAASPGYPDRRAADPLR